MVEGKYIVIEGHDGTGKSTQVKNIRSKLLERGIESIEFHEPAGNPMADAIRDILKNGNLRRDAETNLLLFTAARHELLNQKATPALKMGKWVVTARNYYSTLAYQGYGEGLDLDLIKKITRQFTNERYIEPDISIILDLDDENKRTQRIGNRGELENPDNFESKDSSFQTKVRLGYLAIAEEFKLPIVSASPAPEIVTENIWQYIEPLID